MRRVKREPSSRVHDEMAAWRNSSLVSTYSHDPRHRDAGLDLLRCTALVFMVFAHFPSSSESPFISAVYFLTGSTPALFYFAFGMTFNRFAQKAGMLKFRITFAFFIIAVFLNLAFAGRYIYNEFFFFLWLSQCAMAAIVTCIKKPMRPILLFLCGMLICMVILPHGYITGVFSSVVQGNFPFLPWFIFVLAGYCFAQRHIRAITTGLVLVLISILLYASGGRNLQIEKYPLSATYSMLFSGVAILIYGVGKRIPALSRNRMVVYISENLLLATIVHYITYDVLLAINYAIKHVLGFNVLAGHPNVLIVVLPIVCIAILVALLKAALAAWTICRKNKFVATKIVPNTIAAAIAVLLLYYILGSFAGNGMLLAKRSMMILGMAYFGIIIRETKRMEHMDTDAIYLKSKQAIAWCVHFTRNR
jgi:hypothetical protein